MKHRIRDGFAAVINHDAAAGIMMLIFAVLALWCQNSAFSIDYRSLLETRAGISFGDFELKKPLLLWINDGLVTIFFFSIGLELKHEFMEGQLANKRNVVLPAIAALGGMVTPALCFYLTNMNDPYALRGWAIPTATDAAFAIAILLLLGKRIPSSLKIFLLSLAIFDDIGAIVIIAIFYTGQLSSAAITAACLAIAALAVLNFFHVARKSLYCLIGAFLWFCILKSGVHATLAGIITAFFIPLRDVHTKAPIVHNMYNSLKGWLSFFILPVFVFFNAGIDLTGMSFSTLFNSVGLGIFLGLFVGKQVGVFVFTMACIKLKLAPMPKDAAIAQLYGVCILTGIGFTMSMFVDGLAYWGGDIFGYADSLAILLGSLCSGVVGFFFLLFFGRSKKVTEDDGAVLETAAGEPVPAETADTAVSAEAEYQPAEPPKDYAEEPAGSDPAKA